METRWKHAKRREIEKSCAWLLFFADVVCFDLLVLFSSAAARKTCNDSTRLDSIQCKIMETSEELMLCVNLSEWTLIKSSLRDNDAFSKRERQQKVHWISIRYLRRVLCRFLLRCFGFLARRCQSHKQQGDIGCHSKTLACSLDKTFFSFSFLKNSINFHSRNDTFMCFYDRISFCLGNNNP